MEVHDLIIRLELALKVEADDLEEATEKAGKWIRSLSNQSVLRITNGKYWTKKMPLAVGTTKGKAKTYRQFE